MKLFCGISLLASMSQLFFHLQLSLLLDLSSPKSILKSSNPVITGSLTVTQARLPLSQNHVSKTWGRIFFSYISHMTYPKKCFIFLISWLLCAEQYFCHILIFIHYVWFLSILLFSCQQNVLLSGGSLPKVMLKVWEIRPLQFFWV